MNKRGFLRMLESDYSDPLQWGERFLFQEMKNGDLCRLTGEFYNCNPHGTHPVFILRKIENGYEFCPCSSQTYNNGKASYIRRNSITPPERRPTDKDSYILHFLSFNLHVFDRLIERLPVPGKVAAEDIEGTYHKQGNCK